jgi:polysaccharide deacetylase 2 family uncharacterized protein YibQ
MKKPVKTARKTVSPNRKRTKSVKKRLKTTFSDAIKAFVLVAALVALAAGISLAVIFVYSNTDNTIVSEEDEPIIVTHDAEVIPEVEPSPVVVVVQPEQTAPPAVETRSSTANTDASSAGSSAANASKPPEPSRQTQTPVAAPVTTITTVTTAAALNQARTGEPIGKVAFVIDDAGNNLRELDPFLALPFPLTIAVLPGLPYSAEAARRIRAAGKEVILHQPMEAINGQNPGPGAIYSGMSANQIREILAKNIIEVGPVVGMNNHQGSKITMDREAMETILSFCRDNGLYFLDSRTTADTAAPAVARRLGIKIAERDTFLDNEQNKEAMARYLSSGLARVQRNGSSIMIGHTWSPALAPLLSEQFTSLTIQGYNISTVSDLLR